MRSNASRCAFRCSKAQFDTELRVPQRDSMLSGLRHGFFNGPKRISWSKCVPMLQNAFRFFIRILMLWDAFWCPETRSDTLGGVSMLWYAKAFLMLRDVFWCSKTLFEFDAPNVQNALKFSETIFQCSEALSNAPRRFLCSKTRFYALIKLRSDALKRSNFLSHVSMLRDAFRCSRKMRFDGLKRAPM